MRLFRSSLALAACLGAVVYGCSAHPTQEELVVRAAQPIQGGSIDTGDPAIVGIVINAGGGLAICTGSLIAPNLVLTAHHCVSQTPSSSSGCSTSSFGAQYAASAFRVTSSYNAAASSFNSGSIPTVDGKTWFGAAKVTVAGGNICGQDMAVIELSKPMTGICPIIPRVDSAVASSEGYTAVGFGITSPSGSAAGTRYKVTGLSVQCASSCGGGTSSTMEWIGGSSAAKGTCEGDSGGPALDSAGRVIGTVSRGPASSCNQTVYEGAYGEGAWIKQMAQQAAADGGYAAAGWVTGGATSDPNNGYCGTGGGGTPVDAGTGGGTPDTGSGGGGTGGGTGATCADPSTSCVDATGAGDFGCFASGPAFPTSAATCVADTDCPTNYACWAASAGATSGKCIQSCSTSGSGGGGTGASDAGTGSGGGTSTGAGTCTNAALTCYTFGDGSMACVDGGSSSGIPAGAPTCDSATACPTGYQCYSASGAASGTCLEVCSGATSGGGSTADAGSGSGGGGTGTGTGGTGGGTGSTADAGGSSGGGGLGGLGVVDSGADGGHKHLVNSDTEAAGTCSVNGGVGGGAGGTRAALLGSALAFAAALLARRRRG
jgi:hypothetical protein